MNLTSLHLSSLITDARFDYLLCCPFFDVCVLQMTQGRFKLVVWSESTGEAGVAASCFNPTDQQALASTVGT